MGLGRYLLIPATVWAALGAEESKLNRDGAFWVQTVSGTAAAAPGGRLRISTRGPMTVRGSAADQVQYTITKRIKASSESEARRRLTRFLVRAYQQGDMTTFTVAHAGDGWGSADVNVSAPRGFRDAVIE